IEKQEQIIEEIINNKIYENAFEWRFEFPEVLNNEGDFVGFDVVIGNPPYLQIATISNDKKLKDYFLNRYKSSMGRLNTFGFFTVLGIDLLISQEKAKGKLSFIIPNTLLMQDYYEELRSIILQKTQIRDLVTFDDLPFQEAVVENIIINLDIKKTSNDEINILKVNKVGSFTIIKQLKQFYFDVSNNKTFNLNISEIVNSIKLKLLNGSKSLSTFTSINQAIALKEDRSKWVFKENLNDNYKPLLVGGKNINRYSTNWDNSYLKYDLAGIHSCKREDIFLSKEKILFRRVANQLIATIDNDQFYALHTIVVINNLKGSLWNLKFILGLLNSKVLNWYYKQEFASTKTVFSEIGARQVEMLPIKNIPLLEQYSIINKVSEVLDLKSKSVLIDTSQLENQIDQLVYQLYNLTEEEIKIVEGKS
ncbi:MAG: Eco57I restriction-modification methylase domain-containing protein, partial [Janthinobacterium lividum]